MRIYFLILLPVALAAFLVPSGLADMVALDLGKFNISFEANSSEGYYIKVNSPEIFQLSDGTPYMRYKIELTKDGYENELRSVYISIYHQTNPLFLQSDAFIKEALESEKAWMNSYQQIVNSSLIEVDNHEGYLLKAEYNSEKATWASTPSRLYYALYRLNNRTLVEIESMAPWDRCMSDMLRTLHVEEKE